MGREFPPSPSNRYWSQEDWNELVRIATHRRHRVLDRFRELLLKGTDTSLHDVEIEIDNIVIPGALTLDCDAGTLVTQFVYIDSANHVAPTDASPTGTPSMGVISSKPTATTAHVKTEGPVPGFSGLVPGTEYFLSMAIAGAIVTPANDVGPPGSFNQRVGLALTADTLQVDLEDTPIYF